MKGIRFPVLVVAFFLSCAPPTMANGYAKLALQVAEGVGAKFGAGAVRGGIPALAARIEAGIARYGVRTAGAVERVGPKALGLAERAGVHGERAMQVMATHGEAGVVHVLGRPAAMAQVARFGERGAAVLVKHPGVAEKVVERAGLSAVNAMAAVGPQGGRRLAMLMEGPIGKSGKWAEVLEVVAKYGDRGAAFVWNNKGALATGAVLAAFVADPAPFIEGTKALAGTAGEATVGVARVAGESVVKPVVGGVFTAVNCLIGCVALVVVGAVVLMWKHGVPSASTVKPTADAVRGK